MQIKYRNFVFYIVLFLLRFVGTVYFITSSHVITEYSIILAKYFPFSQLHVADSKYNLFQIHEVFCTHIDIYRYSTIDLNYIFSIKCTFTFV